MIISPAWMGIKLAGTGRGLDHELKTRRAISLLMCDRMADEDRDVYQEGDPRPAGCKTLWLGDVQVRTDS